MKKKKGKEYGIDMKEEIKLSKKKKKESGHESRKEGENRPLPYHRIKTCCSASHFPLSASRFPPVPVPCALRSLHISRPAAALSDVRDPLRNRIRH